MSRRLAIIGTSHVAALALAWMEMRSDWPDLSVTFFAAPGWNFRRLQLDADKRFGILDPTLFEPAEIRLLKDSFGMTRLELATFDAVLHVGHDIRMTDLVSLLANFSIDELRPLAGMRLMSTLAYARFSDALAEQALLPEEWHNWNTPGLFVLSAPRYSESCAGAGGPTYKDWAALLQQDADGCPFAAPLTAYCDHVQKCFARAGITLLFPPERVLGKSGLTQAHFTRDARQLTNKVYSKVDHKHMNSEYGRIVLTHALEQIARVIGLSVPDAAL